MADYLKIPKRERGKGEYVYCSKCKTNVNNLCKNSGKRIHTCKFPQLHRYKAVYLVPDTGGLRLSTHFNTRDYKEFKKQAIAFFEEMDSYDITLNNYNQIKEMLRERKRQQKTKKVKAKEAKRKTIVDINRIPVKVSKKPLAYKDVVQMYLDYMSDVDVPDYKKKKYAKKYIDELSRYFTHFAIVLKRLGHNPAKFPINHIGEDEVSGLHNYFENEEKDDGSPKFGPHTYNKGMAVMRKLFRYLNDEKEYNIKDPFVGVKEKVVVKDDIKTIRMDEFKKLLSVIKPENGFAIKKDRNRTYRTNFYKDWMKDAFRLALETGERRDGIAYMTWDNVNMDAQIIRLRNHKVSNMQKREVIRKIPITVGLKNLLYEMGYNEKKDSKEFIIGNEYNTRKTVMDLISKAFDHFWKLTDIDKGDKISFKHLRKTYATLMMKHFGDDASKITGQSVDTIIKHYLDKEAIMVKARHLTLSQIESKLGSESIKN